MSDSDSVKDQMKEQKRKEYMKRLRIENSLAKGLSDSQLQSVIDFHEKIKQAAIEIDKMLTSETYKQLEEVEMVTPERLLGMRNTAVFEFMSYLIDTHMAVEHKIVEKFSEIDATGIDATGISPISTGRISEEEKNRENREKAVLGKMFGGEVVTHTVDGVNFAHFKMQSNMCAECQKEANK